VRIQVRVGADGIVSDARFKAFGCPATIACGSWTTDRVRGRPLEEARGLAAETIARALDLPEDRWGCAAITQGALVAALDGLSGRGDAPE
jgi:NifU-like protein involved in Fe-S cluster formation